jgi:hypothetical protein
MQKTMNSCNNKRVAENRAESRTIKKHLHQHPPQLEKEALVTLFNGNDSHPHSKIRLHMPGGEATIPLRPSERTCAI